MGADGVPPGILQSPRHLIMAKWTLNLYAMSARSEFGRRGGKARRKAKSPAKQRANPGLAEGRKKLASLSPEQRSENAKKAATGEGGKNFHTPQPEFKNIPAFFISPPGALWLPRVSSFQDTKAPGSNQDRCQVGTRRSQYPIFQVVLILHQRLSV